MHIYKLHLRLLPFYFFSANESFFVKEDEMSKTATAEIPSNPRSIEQRRSAHEARGQDSLLTRVLAPHSEHVYATLRILIGALFAFHGMQKVFGIFATYQPPLFSQLWIGGVLELAAGLLIAVGLFTRWAAFIASGMMAVAYVQFHWKFQFDASFFPAVNKGELAVVYSFVFLFFAAKGAGDWSIDARRERLPKANRL
jgi:putative oxidoreductase